MEIRRITAENQQDINLKNEPFAMSGRFIPELKEGIWSFRTEAFEKPSEMTFPDENYDFAKLSKNGVIYGAYENDECIRLAVYQEYWLKYMYLFDLKVCAAARGKGVGKALIQAGMGAAKERGYIGLYTQAQDDNLNACMFYLKAGFKIGGFDNRVYGGTSQSHKADIIFYLDEK